MMKVKKKYIAQLDLTKEQLKSLSILESSKGHCRKVLCVDCILDKYCILANKEKEEDKSCVYCTDIKPKNCDVENNGVPEEDIKTFKKNIKKFKEVLGVE